MKNATTPFPTKDEALALELIKFNTDADPFALEPFRRLSFWFKAWLVARRNGKDFLACKARQKFRLLAQTLTDVTGCVETLQKGVDFRNAADRNSLAETARILSK